MSIDIAAFQNVSEQKFVGRLFDESGGKAISGPEKAAQQFIIFLMTPRGSVPYRPDYGTLLVPTLESRSCRTELDVFQAFAVAALETVTFFKRYRDFRPPDERVDAAAIRNLVVAPGAVVLEIALRTEDKQIVQRRIPISFKWS